MQEERRASPRVAVSLEAAYRLSPGNPMPRPGWLKDISLGGSLIYQTEPLRPGSKISVTIGLPSEGQVVLPGTVAWCRESRMGHGGYEAGIQWGELNPIFQARLSTFLAHRVQPKGPEISSVARSAATARIRSYAPASLTEPFGRPTPSPLWRLIILGLIGLGIFLLVTLIWQDLYGYRPTHLF